MIFFFRDRGREGEREGGEGREGDIYLFFQLFMLLLADSYICSDQGLTPQPWHIRTMPKPNELPGLGLEILNRDRQLCVLWLCINMDL